MLFSRWGAFVYRFRKLDRSSSRSSSPPARSCSPRKASSALSSGGWFDPTSESATVSQRLADEYDAGRATIVALFRGAARRRRPVGSVPGGDRRQSLDRLAADGRVNGVIGYAQTHDDRFICTDGDDRPTSSSTSRSPTRQRST